MSGRIERARGLVSRGGWIEAAGEAYALRRGPDRRSRVSMTLVEAEFRALVERPGLRTRRGGGWMAKDGPERSGARDGPGDEGPAPGRPGVVLGERAVIEADGGVTLRRANLSQSPIAWLARRKDPSGRPWLTPAEIAAGERLRADAEIALSGPSLTMRWDALPRAGGGTAARVEPGDRAIAAARRVEAALAAAGPRLRAMLDSVCIRETALQAAEQALGLRRRQGKTVLKHGLQALAEHYGIG